MQSAVGPHTAQPRLKGGTLTEVWILRVCIVAVPSSGPLCWHCLEAAHRSGSVFSQPDSPSPHEAAAPAIFLLMGWKGALRGVSRASI